ncbi:MAG: glycoside hydrolase [Anaerolineae bacterium]|nr:glycoside hydrolase [Anaerolineae bacterium]
MTDPFFSITNLFEANTNGYINYRIPGICVTPNGVALAHTEARKGRGGDWDMIDILMRRSFDQGSTWEAPRKIIDHADFGDGPIHNCNTIVDSVTGEVHVLFCFGYARAFHMKSDDDGKTFSKPVDITSTFEQFRPEYDWGVLAIGLPNGIQLTSGRLIIPVWLSISKTKAHRPNRCAVIYSDDHGQSWQRGAMVPDVVPNLNETSIVELSDGRVLLNMRNGVGVKRRVITTCPTGIDNWETPWLDPALLEPTCQGTVFRLSTASEGHNRILFCNPDNADGKDKKGPDIFLTRKNLTVKLSDDDCRTWPVSKVIEPGFSGYSGLAVCPDKTILCAFERGGPDGVDSDDYLAVARFNLAWLTDGSDPV